MIELYTWPTPNGHKIHIMLEETGLPYRVHPVDIGAGDQFKPEFLKISPNNKMPARIPYAMQRYSKEANRLYGVMDRRLAESKFIACDEYTIADMAIMPWLRSYKNQGVEMDEYRKVKRWFDGIAARPAV